MIDAIRGARVLACALAFVLAGCNGGGGDGGPQATLGGRVASGDVAVGGATVSIYRVQGTATLVADTTTDAGGQFLVPVPVGDGLYYAVARRGATLELAAVLGTTLPSSATVNELSTVATAYALAQFFDEGGRIAGPAQALGVAAGMGRNLVDVATARPSRVLTSSPNADQTNAWRVLDTLGNVLAACVRELPGACAALFAAAPSATGVRPTTTLQAVRNIARNPAANVAAIFALREAATPYTPSLTAVQGPDSTDRLQKLDAWTLAVKFNATGGDPSCQFGGPGNVVFDRNGYAWITMNTVQATPVSANCVVVLKPDGSPADGSNGTVRSPVTGGGIVGGGFGISIDGLGRVWPGNFGWGGAQYFPVGGVSEFTPAGVALSPSTGWVSGTYRVQGVDVDAGNNVWIASWGNDAVVVFPNGNANAAYPPYVDHNTKPFGVAAARDGATWVSYQGSSTLSKFTLANNALVKSFTVPVGTGGNPKGVALDTRGNAWVASGKTSLVHVFRPDGTQLMPALSGRGIEGPWGLSIDARDNVWIANFGDDDNLDARYSVVQLCGVDTAQCPPGKATGDAVSPPSGWTLPSAGSPVLLANGQPLYPPPNPPSYKPLMRLTSVHPDMAGNVWATNNWKPSVVVDVGGAPFDPSGNPGGDGIVVFIGIAAPTRAPNVGQPLPP